MKILLLVILFAFSDASPGYSGSSSTGNDIADGSSNSGGSSYSYAGSGSIPANIPSFVPFFPQFDFSAFFEQLKRQHQEFIKHAQGGFNEVSVGAGAGAGAGSYGSGYGGGFGGSYGHGYGLGNRGGFVGGYGGGYAGPDGNSYSFSGPIGDNSAFASGSIGPGRGHVTAAINPENPNSPNVNTRFGGSDGGGFKSVFTSSKSVSTNVDGKPQTYRQASTTINDNGKVTTYTAHNP